MCWTFFRRCIMAKWKRHINTVLKTYQQHELKNRVHNRHGGRHSIENWHRQYTEWIEVVRKVHAKTVNDKNQFTKLSLTCIFLIDNLRSYRENSQLQSPSPSTFPSPTTTKEVIFKTFRSQMYKGCLLYTSLGVFSLSYNIKIKFNLHLDMHI